MTNYQPHLTSTAIAPVLNKDSTMIAKSAPWFARHRDYLPAKVPGLLIGWLRKPTLTHFIAGPLQVIFIPQFQIIPKDLPNDNFSTFS
jgi:hypothetical protein